MTRDDIIRMARKAGLLPHPENIVYQDPMFEGRIKTFAALVAEHEREACAMEAEYEAARWPYAPECREPCEEIAAAIRARGQE